jgi:hypothetical protein
VARELATLGVPFVFCRVIRRKEAWPHAPVLSEPFTGADLIEMLRRLPASGNQLQYRIKSAAEPFERVVNENELSLRL